MLFLCNLQNLDARVCKSGSCESKGAPANVSVGGKVTDTSREQTLIETAAYVGHVSDATHGLLSPEHRLEYHGGLVFPLLNIGAYLARRQGLDGPQLLLL
jgi:hypothetical protein